MSIALHIIEQQRPEPAWPLVVDLEGAFLATDVTIEAWVQVLMNRPLEGLALGGNLLLGRTGTPQRAHHLQQLDYKSLPKNTAFLDFLLQQHALGRDLHLVSDLDQSVLEKMGEAYPIFSSVQGSLQSASEKLDYLTAKFPTGFSYASGKAADLTVIQQAKTSILIGAEGKIAREAHTLDPALEAIFDAQKPRFKLWLKALRLHQWSKNLLLFIPALLSVSNTPIMNGLLCLMGFLLLGMAASATYLINDMADLASDRRHRTKNQRPFASGDLPLAHGLVVAPLMLCVSLILSFALSPGFFGLVMLYVVLTLSYSLALKRVALLDVVILAVLYTLRLFMGMVIVGIGSSAWLLAFASIFFFSMSLAKRHTELLAAKVPGDEQISGRGYRPNDWPLTLAFGVASSVASISIMIQYLMAEAFPSNTYSYPAALWFAPFLIGLWTCRI
jgi:4-hydroxybenzoate polyprenyltransferase